MVGLFGVFAILFIRDWKVGYPKSNVVYFTYGAFEEAKEEFAQREEAGQDAAAWESFAGGQLIGFPEEPGVLPEGTELEAHWPEILVNYEGYQAAFDEGRELNVPPAWLDYSHQQGWNSTKPKTSHDLGKIKEQLYFGILMTVLSILAFFYLMRTGRRSMRVDAEAYYPPEGGRIPYGQIRRIDKRKWGAKGLAYLFYELEGGGQAKTKVDGMVYGQFREEDDAPAERLFQQILKNFSGELIELELEPDPSSESNEEEAPRE